MADEIQNPLLSLIRDQGLIDDLQYEEVAAEHKRAGTPVGQILQDFGIMDIDAILPTISNYMGADVISLQNRDFPQDLIKTIPSNTARMYRCIPVAMNGSALQVAFEDPLNPARVDEVGFIVKRDLQPVIANPSEISVQRSE